MAIKKQELPGIGTDIGPDIGYLITYEQMHTLITFQELWTDLSAWLRALLISMAENLEDQEAVTHQLYSIPADFYNIFRVFYGPSISQQLLNLLSGLTTDARNLIASLIAGDDESVDLNLSQMYRTVNDLAAFLSRINVYWDEDQWTYLLNQFVRLFVNEAVAYLSKNYEQEIQIYNRLDDLTDIMGSYMARGIIARSAAGSLTPAEGTR
ncbi:MAG TPA: hypothetical protein PKA19_02530 [Bacillota bacterium]|nr:hypothetical protein [Bacillota bacterium]